MGMTGDAELHDHEMVSDTASMLHRTSSPPAGTCLHTDKRIGLAPAHCASTM
jgi:hypothetical protein